MARYLITAGPTRESIDPVRFLSNRSSGRMGYAIASALLELGHQVELVSGPVNIEPPTGANTTQVESALEMLAAAEQLWGQCDGIFGVAAVADYRPANTSAEKLKRQADTLFSLQLEPNPDILATLAAKKDQRLAVGFALESDPSHNEAKRKLVAKNLDFVALNGISAQGAVQSAITLLDGADGIWQLGPAEKSELARELVRAVGITASRA
ncbi:MAG: phosphopantothenoylcysteine decarboxylase [Planctomycetes bacterium]|nr:phosphopantothenoylcysteine decarboxylase [Planctomycetota bacterium]MCP4769959.1 phosphopantothenoylcysteine decarboxylase [Planctomycetota bacterium]MCP4859799.1 phosphopantothenoylcysteine decarboxylase [Planctomycetota bacterium]